MQDGSDRLRTLENALAARDWEELCRTLTDIPNLRNALVADRQSVVDCWKRIEVETSHRAVEVYRAWIEHPVKDSDTCEPVAVLLDSLGYRREACSLWEHLATFYRENAFLERLNTALRLQGYLLLHLGDLDRAQAVYRERRELCRALGDRLGVVVSLVKEAAVLVAKSDIAGALGLNYEAVELSKTLEEKREYYAKVLIERGKILEKAGDPDLALVLYREVEELARYKSWQFELGRAFGRQANILEARKDLTGALYVLRRQYEIWSSLKNQTKIKRNRRRHQQILQKLASAPAADEPVLGSGIRVFISSAFIDMKEERGELLSYVGPVLRKKCEDKGISFSYIDLRWGITDEQKAEGKVLERCLTGIDRCRPFFIGLLGSHYGSIPDRMPSDLLAREPWLGQYADRSVVKLEMLHGALNAPEKARYAFFYARETESDAPLDIEEQKLAALRDRLRRSPLKLRGYRNARELRDIVIADLSAAIDEIALSKSAEGELFRPTAEQEAFLSAAAAHVHLVRAYDFSRLDEHVRREGHPLVVCGAPGSGKTALFANWIFRRRLEARSEHLFFHFIARGPRLRDMLSRLVGDMRREFELPDDFAESLGLGESFNRCLQLASGKGKSVLVIDGLDQLEDQEGALDLAWLPRQIPSNLRLIVSTSGGATFADLVDRKWVSFEVAPLTVAERQELITTTLSRYEKAIQPELVERIATAESSALPRYLRTLLDEIRYYGDHSTLCGRVDHYLTAARTSDLFVLVLERYEEVYENDRPFLVRDAMSALWAARKGLSESELLDLLGTKGARLPADLWLPLYVAIERALTRHSEVLSLQSALRLAVERRYLVAEADRRTAHSRLALFFKHRKVDNRKLEELPWQLAAAEEWDGLYELLRSPSCLPGLWRCSESEVMAYWAQLEEHSTRRLVDGYRFVYENLTDADVGFAEIVALLLMRAGSCREAIVISDWLLGRYRTAGNQDQVASALNNLGISVMGLRELDQLDRALDCFLQAESICRRSDNRPVLSIVLVNRATVMIKKYGRTAKVRLRDIIGMKKSPSPLLTEALQILQEQEALSRALKNPRRLSESLLKQGQILTILDDPRGLEVLRQSEPLLSETGDRAKLAWCLQLQGYFLVLHGERDAGIRQLDRCDAILKALGDKQGLTFLRNLRGLLGAMGLAYILDPIREFVDYADEEIRLRETGQESTIPARLGQAYILSAIQDRNTRMQGLERYRQVARSCHEAGDREHLGEALLAISSILFVTMAPSRTALPVFAEALRLARANKLFSSWYVLQGMRLLLLPCRLFLTNALRLACWILAKLEPGRGWEQETEAVLREVVWVEPLEKRSGE